METCPEIMADRNVDSSANLRVCIREERAGFFIIHPIGSINTNTYLILQKELERIFKTGPEIILFDMKQINYVNFRGLRVILKTITELNQHKGKIFFTNFQPQVKEMLVIMIALLPECVFGGRKQLEDLLNVNHGTCSENKKWTRSEDTKKNSNLFLLS